MDALPEYEVDTEVIHVASKRVPVAVLTRLTEVTETVETLPGGAVRSIVTRKVIDSWKHEVQVRR